MQAKNLILTSIKSPGALLAVLWLFVLSTAAATLDLLPFMNPDQSDFENIATGPSALHLLGTDEIGRDILSRTIAASQISLQVGFVAVAIAAVIGGTSLFGGKGKVRDAILGGLVVAVIDNGMGLLGYAAGIKFIVTGLVLLVSAGVDAISRRGNLTP
jgi:ABC-type dipeptide/oligopeptide/nickel transport system permease subunit